MNETPLCKTHPDAPHGFDRNASHSADRYVCECESWEPPEETLTLDRGCWERGCVAYDERDGDGVTIKPDRVDKTAKREHDLWIAAACLKSTVEAAIKAGDWKVDGACDPTMDLQYLANCFSSIQNREWVGLTDEEIYDYADKFLYQHGSNYGIKSFGKAIEAKLKEKNT